MSDEDEIERQISPLRFTEAEWARADNAASISPEAILRFLCPPGTLADASSLVDRYKRISAEAAKLCVVSVELRILEKLVWPLRAAQASYILGNNLAVIALCGIVAEMVAVLLWRSAEAKIDGKKFSRRDEKALFGSDFESLGQYRRVKILVAYGIVVRPVEQLFDTIRSKRNQYLHRWSKDHESLSKDAEECFHAAVGVVRETLCLDDFDDMFLLEPNLMKFLRQRGTYQPVSDSQ